MDDSREKEYDQIWAKALEIHDRAWQGVHHSDIDFLVHAIALLIDENTALRKPPPILHLVQSNCPLPITKIEDRYEASSKQSQKNSETT